jgi:pimeloyl-ACP methyl ester carboxylesterase
MTATETTHTYRSHEGLELFYRDYAGTGLTVVCLPGLTRNSQDFRPLAQHLSPRYRVLTPDLRGRGRSAWDPNWQNYHPGTYVTDLIGLLDHAGVGRAAVIGTSLGGIVGMLAGAQHGTRLAGLVLNDVGPEVAPEGAARISKYVGSQPPVRNWREAVEQVRATYGVALPDLSDADWERYARQSYREDERGVPRPDMDPMIGEAMRRAAGTGATPNLWPLWGMLGNLPTLAIRGASSDILSAPTLERMAREKPDLMRVTVANRGHAPTLEEPVCRQAIDGFLSKLR